MAAPIPPGGSSFPGSPAAKPGKEPAERRAGPGRPGLPENALGASGPQLPAALLRWSFPANRLLQLAQHQIRRAVVDAAQPQYAGMRTVGLRHHVAKDCSVAVAVDKPQPVGGTCGAPQGGVDGHPCLMGVFAVQVQRDNARP